MNCPICHAEMVMDYKIKVENYLLFNMITIKKGSDQKKIKAAFCPSCGKIELYADIPSGEFLPVKKNKHIQFPGC